MYCNKSQLALDVWLSFEAFASLQVRQMSCGWFPHIWDDLEDEKEGGIQMRL